MKLLEREFYGIGEVKGFKFIRIASTRHCFMYKVHSGGINAHYEVFYRKKTPLCIDFKNRIYSETEFKEVYPKAMDFGVWAWTYSNYNKALSKFNEINKQYETKKD